MKQLLFINLMLFGLFSNSLHAEEGLLTDEQLAHEAEMKALVMEKALLSEKLERAKLLKECRDLGVPGCGSSSGSDYFAPMDSDSEGQIIPGGIRVIAGSPPPQNEIVEDVVVRTSGKPVLMGIQNKSAKVSYGGGYKWLGVGSKIGPWKVLYIDASKIRIKNIVNAETTTLIMNW